MLRRLSIGVGGLGAYLATNYHLSKGTPLHVATPIHPKIVVGGVNILPVIASVLEGLPSSAREYLLAKGSAPKSEDVKDAHDHFGRNPYRIVEVKPGKIWKVLYDLEPFTMLGEQERASLPIIGLDHESEEGAWRVMQGAESCGRAASEQAHKDLELYRRVKADLDKGEIGKEMLETLGWMEQSMLVVKLTSGGLLLYNPVKIREDHGFAEWLESLGRVEWLVSASSAHTLCLPSVLKRYPEAVFMASRDAAVKLEAAGLLGEKATGGRRLDYDYTRMEDLAKARDSLKEEGVSLHYIEGDVLTSSLMAVAHRVALEVDIVYSDSDGGLLGRKWQEQENFMVRLFQWALASKPTSPNDALPPYRFWAMDPASPMRSLLLSPAKRDGSSCVSMARSLRLALAQDFDMATGVHIAGTMSRDQFRESVELNWAWLDGKSLLD